MQVRLLGPVEVADHEGNAIVVGGPKERIVLAVLAVHANQAVSRARLEDAIWGDEPPRTAAKTLQSYISRLRRALGDALSLESTPAGYVLRIEPAALDVTAAEAFLADARDALAADDAERAFELAAQAEVLWRGPSMGDLAGEPFAIAESARLEELRAYAVETRLEAELARGRHAEAVAPLERACTAHPLRERLWGLRILALYRSGRQADALRAFQDLRRVLGDGLGIEPSPELRQLEGAVLSQDPSLDWRPRAERSAALPSGVVTFLLTDIEDSTPLWESNPGDMALALERHDALIDEVVSAHDGTVLKAKGEGDATLSVFRRASDAARAAAALSTRLCDETWPDGLDLRVRVALHTGEAHERAGDFFGPTLNRAARIRSVASGGQVVVSDVTANLVRDRLPEGAVLADLGEHALRGLERGERIWQLAATGADTARSSYDGETPPPAADGPAFTEQPLPSALVPTTANFVGRHDEREQLRAAWRGASTEGTPRLVLLAGEPGIGKTRLAAELAREANDEGALVLFGRCDEDLGIPYQPWSEALRSLVLSCPTDLLQRHVARHAGEIGRLVPDLTARLPNAPLPSSASPEEIRSRLFDAVVRLLSDASALAPVLVVADDLHWADRPTLLLLRHLVRVEAPLRLLVVGTYRDTDLDRAHPLAEVAADLRRDAAVQRLAVRGLTPDGVAAFLAGAAGHDLPPEGRDLAAALHRETRGNPFFVGEVVRHLVERGVLYQSDGRWTSEVAVEDLGLPEGVRDVITRRLSRLSEATNQALRVAALLGQSFSLRLLEAAAGDDDGSDDLLDSLDEAVAAGLLEEQPGGFAFSHALVRQTLASELTGARRARLHRRIGEAIELLPDAEQHVEALAHHFGHAALDGQLEKATRYALLAGQRANHRAAFEEARTHLEGGLALLDLDADPDPARQAELLLERHRAEFFNSTLDLEDIIDHAGAAFEAARRAGRADLLARAAAAMTEFGIIGSADQQAVDACHEALAALGPHGDPALRALVLAGVAKYRAWQGGEGAAVDSIAVEAVELARASGDDDALATALARRQSVLSGSPDLARRTAVNDEAMALATRRNDPFHAADALMQQGQLAGQRGDRDGLEATLAALEATPGGTLFVPLLVNHVRLLDGRFEEAMEAAMVGLGVTVDLEAHVLTVAREQGRIEEFLPLLRDLADQNPGVSAVQPALAAWEGELGLLEDAQARVSSRVTLLDTIPSDATFVVALAMVTEAAVSCGDEAAAAVLRDQLAPWSGQIVVSPVETSYGAADRYLAMVSALLGDAADAEARFAAALELEEAFRAPVFQARTLLWWGRARLSAGDVTGARELLERSHRMATELGMQKVAADAASALDCAVPPLPSALLPASTNFVGRDAERAQLCTAWRGASTEGTPRLVLLAGEPGVGKTRLAAEIARVAHDDRALVLFGRCDEDLGIPYQPWAEALRSLIAESPMALLEEHVQQHGGEIGRLVPGLTRRLPSTPQPSTDDPEQVRPRLFDAVTSLLAAASRRGPVLLVADDLHWADRPTLLLLRHLVRVEAPLRMLVVGTYRDTDLDRTHALSELAADLRREAGVVRVSVRGLSEDGVAAYLAGAAGHELPPEGLALATALHRETQGNPFFVGEVVRHLVERGVLVESDGRWTSDVDIEDLGLPEGVREVITRRLSRLSDQANRALRVAALLGQSFSLRLLEAVPDATAEGGDLLDTLDEAIAAGLLHESADGFAFSHALVRQTLASELTGARRTRLHRHIGEAIEALPDAGRHVESLAYHFDQAALDGQLEKATRYALLAANQACERAAYEEARVHVTRGLELLDLDPQPDQARRAELLLAAFETAQFGTELETGRSERVALRHLRREATEAARRSGRVDLLARAASSIIGSGGTLGDGDSEVPDACEEALAALGPTGDLVLRARVLARLAGYRAWQGGEGAAVDDLARQAVELAVESGDEETLRLALATRGVTLSGSPDLAQRAAVSDQALALARRSRNPWALGSALLRQAEVVVQRGDRDLHDAVASELAEGVYAEHRYLGPNVRLLLEGDLAEALRVLLDNLEDASVNTHAQLLTVARELGVMEEHLPMLRSVVAANPSVSALQAGLAMWESELGMVEEATARLAGITAEFDALPRDASFEAALAFLIEAAAACGRSDAVAALRDELRPWSGQIVVAPGATATYGAVDRFLAMAAALLGDHAEAETLFAGAHALEERFRAPVLQARTLLWWGRARLAAGDVAGARELLERSRRLATDMGMKQVAADAAAALAGATPES